MKLRSNIFLRGILTHCYQRTVDGYLIFYTIEDFLLFYTLLCTIAPKYRIRIYKVTLMPDHYHLVLTAECFEDLAHFIAELTSRFTKAQNVELQRKGALFEGPFGFSLKKQEKDARSAFIYADNNTVGPFSHMHSLTIRSPEKSAGAMREKHSARCWTGSTGCMRTGNLHPTDFCSINFPD